MSKHPLTPAEITQIINAYLSAVAQRHGERARERTELSYHKGDFLLRSHTIVSTAPAIPFRAREIEAMTREMLPKLTVTKIKAVCALMEADLGPWVEVNGPSKSSLDQ